MTDNLRIWNALGKTDPAHTKQFKRAGGFSGTAMKPIWMVKRLTEMFGPAGSGWGMEKPEFQVVNAGDEILVFCTVGLWYEEDGARRMVYGVGGDKVLGKNKYGPFTNDEAFKASYTDALSNAMKQIGVGADIHMGLFEDEKYVRQTEREFMNPSPNQTLMRNFPPDQDVIAGSERWVSEQKTLLTNASTSEDVKGWYKTNEKAVKKLFKDNEPLWQSIKDAYDDALDRVRAPV